MAVVTWDGSTDTDYGTAANWDTGSVPTSSDDVIIANVTNDCVLDGSRSVNSFTVLSGGKFNGNTEMLTVVGEADGSGATSNGFAVNIDGVIVGTNTNITITTPTATTVDFYAQGGGKVRHVTINHASCVATLGALLDISGNLTITLGELNTNSGSNYAVTVAGTTRIGPASGGADQATLTCNDSTVSLGSGLTSDYGLTVVKGGTFDGGSGNHTIGSINVANFGDAKMDFTSGDTTVDSEKTGDNRNIITNVNSTVTHSNGTIIMTFAGNTEISWESTTSGNEGPYNFTVNNASAIQRSRRSPFRVLGDLKILAGEYNTLSGDSGGDLDLTVTGSTIVGAGGGSADDSTLTCNTSTVSLGSGKTDGLGLHVKQGGTFAGGSGTHTIGSISVDNNAAAKCTFSSGATELNGHGGSGLSNRIIIGGADSVNTAAGTQTITTASSYNLESSVNDLINNLVLNSNQTATMTNTLMIAGNLTISQGTLTTSGSNHALTVTGDVIIAAAGGLTCNSSTVSVDSITISANGTLNAPDASGSLTLNGTLSAWSFQNNSTNFNHNNGTITQTNAGHIKSVSSNPMYNFILNSSSSDSHEAVFRPKTGTDCVIAANDVTITRGVLKLNTASHNASMGSLTIGSTGTYFATSGTTTITSESSGGNAINNDGSFVHNKGTVKIDHDTSTNLDIIGTTGVDLYNLIVDSDGTVNYNRSIIENNLTKLGSGLMRPTGDTGRDLTVKGTLLVQAGTFGRGANDTHTNTFGNIVVEGGELILTGGGGSGKTIVNGSFRNVGGTITSH